MAQSSLANSSSNLNLSRRRTAVFQEIILLGNKMSQVLHPDHPLPLPKERTRLGRKWKSLMLALVKML